VQFCSCRRVTSSTRTGSCRFGLAPILTRCDDRSRSRHNSAASIADQHQPSMLRIAQSALLLSAFIPLALRAQESAPRVLTLEQAIGMAQERNAGLLAVRQKVEEAERRNRVVFSNYLPRVATQGAFIGSDNSKGITVPAGALGTVPGVGAFPPISSNIQDLSPNMGFALTTVQQPVTQFFAIREGFGVSRADVSISRAELRRTEQAVSIGVAKAYAGMLIATKRRDVARARLATATIRTSTQAAAVQSGMATNIANTEARVRALVRGLFLPRPAEDGGGGPSAEERMVEGAWILTCGCRPLRHALFGARHLPRPLRDVGGKGFTLRWRGGRSGRGSW